MTVPIVITVLVAGVIGALLRYATSLAFARRPSFPWAVLVVNAVASTLGGVALGLAYRGAISAEWRLILLTGLCGGLSTFSTWSVETVQLVQSGRWRTALTSVALNLAVSLGFATLAFVLV
ncbi:MAG: CrcB family protein [Actinomycetota bacterium]